MLHVLSRREPTGLSSPSTETGSECSRLVGMVSKWILPFTNGPILVALFQAAPYKYGFSSRDIGPNLFKLANIDFWHQPYSQA